MQNVIAYISNVVWGTYPLITSVLESPYSATVFSTLICQHRGVADNFGIPAPILFGTFAGQRGIKCLLSASRAICDS